MPKRTTLLTILDGWGHSDDSKHNAIAAANTPNWDKLWAQNAHTLIDCSGAAVGLPDGQMGNSEVGHLCLGAGRVVYQDFTRISRSIEKGDFFTNHILTSGIDQATQSNHAVHIIGLLSPGGVHSHEDQIHAAAELAVKRGAKQLYVHAFLDGRDTPPRSAEGSLKRMQTKLDTLGTGQIASLIGRYYAMDRDQRWDRIQQAYDLLTLGQASFRATTALGGLNDAYQRDENDEFVKATRIDSVGGAIRDGDTVIFMNYRADRARQLARSFVDTSFDGFERQLVPKLSAFICLTQYQSGLEAQVAYPPEHLPNTLGEVIATRGLSQLRIAETEKYAHVTFFFSGGEETPFKGENRILVPSPNVATYDLQPEMNAPALTDQLIKAIESKSYDLIICNFANPDMVGHTGKFSAAVIAVETIDDCLGRITKALAAHQGELLLTADHGNVEQMEDHSTGQAHTAHTTNLVPLIYVGRQATLSPNGSLADIAPTLLAIMDQFQPSEMTGRSLITWQ